ncbi:hypothetical protein Tco_0922727 [Tanacetum coccineum]|uniref:Helitron helicase-like domain-containing protein n=1 Tax=Tanacetum coccineum TaxID=301880 RepID=A0ABQ5D292_9ASTR
MKRKKPHFEIIGNSTHSFLDDALGDRLSDIHTLDFNRVEVVARSAHSSPQSRTITNMVELEQHSMTNNSDLAGKKKYRRESFLRWKNKTYKTNSHFASGECNTTFTTNEFSEQVGPSNLSSFVINETTDQNHTKRKRSKSRSQGHIPTMGRDLLSFIASSASVLPRMQDCPHCGAVKFYSETKNFCCLNGRVSLSSNELPDSLKQLLTSTSEEAKTFRTYIRTYNNLFAFTSLGVRADANLSKRNNGIYTFRVQGQVYHFINDLVPQNGNAKNLQLYFHDTDHEVENRLASCERLAQQAIELCMKALENNPYACFFRSLKDVPQLENYKIILKTIPSQDQRLYNKPEVSQVAAVWVDGEGNGEQNPRDIEVKTHSNALSQIQILNFHLL